MIQQYLEDLERRIDPEVEEDLLARWCDFADGKLADGFFAPRRAKAAPPSVVWPKVRVNEALSDMDRMVLHQLAQCSEVLARGGGALLNVRPNYGAGILPSLFGAELFVMEEELNTLPTSKPVAGGVDAIRRIIEAGVPEPQSGLGGACFAMARQFTALFQDYPNIAAYVRIYHPDLQGPIDACELLLGSDMFLLLVDEPALMKKLLQTVTLAYARFMREWLGLVESREVYSRHWGMLHKGRIMLRDDSAVNLSPEMFDEFVFQYDQRLLAEFGGGAIHFCGRGDHYIDRMSRMTGLFAVNVSQPECNDMERIFRWTVDRGIKLIGLPRAEVEGALARGRPLRGCVHCW